MSSQNKNAKNIRHGRAQARLCVMQALYQWQLTDQTFAEIKQQFLGRDELGRADVAYFEELLQGCIERHENLAQLIGTALDRPWEQLDPIERAILLQGMYELQERLDIPYRVVVNEAVSLSKKFGATDGYKYINALLDKLSKTIRAAERAAADH